MDEMANGGEQADVKTDNGLVRSLAEGMLPSNDADAVVINSATHGDGDDRWAGDFQRMRRSFAWWFGCGNRGIRGHGGLAALDGGGEAILVAEDESDPGIRERVIKNDRRRWSEEGDFGQVRDVSISRSFGLDLRREKAGEWEEKCDESFHGGGL